MNFKEHLYSFMNKNEADKLLSSFNDTPFNAFKVNSLKCVDINNLININNLTPLKHIKNAYFYNKCENELGKDLLFYAGAYYIQEPAAMLAETLLNIKPGDRVLDMCAAPGGKTFNALIDMNDQGLLVCNDISKIRSKVLSSNIEKYGFKNTIVLNDDSKNYKSKFINFFDKIILDAPCSGSGMFRKDSFSIKDWSIEKVNACKQIQLSLFEDAYEMLKGQGIMLYSTCSYSIQENEEVIIEFLNNHNDMEIINISLNNLYNNSIGISGGLRLYPYKYDGEGQVMFLLKKNSDVSYVLKQTKKNKNKYRIEKEVLEFLDYLKYPYSKEKITKINNQYYYYNFENIDLSSINVLRYGIHLGYMENNRFIPSHTLAMVHDIDKSLFIELDKNQATDYMQGLEVKINNSNKKGYAIASYKGLALGFVKQVNSTLKNHLPKGLRITKNLIV